MSVAVAIIHALLILIFAPASLLKLIGHPHMRAEFAKFRYPYSVAHLAGAIEALATCLLVAGFWYPVLAGTGSLLLVPVMIGAAITNFTKRPAVYGWGTLVIVVMCSTSAGYYLRGLVG